MLEAEVGEFRETVFEGLVEEMLDSLFAELRIPLGDVGWGEGFAEFVSVSVEGVELDGGLGFLGFHAGLDCRTTTQ